MIKKHCDQCDAPIAEDAIHYEVATRGPIISTYSWSRADLCSKACALAWIEEHDPGEST